MPTAGGLRCEMATGDCPGPSFMESDSRDDGGMTGGGDRRDCEQGGRTSRSLRRPSGNIGPATSNPG